MLPPSGSTRPILLLQGSLSLRTSRTLRTPRQRTSNPPTLGVIFWLEHRQGDLRNPPPQAQRTHLALGLVEDAVHGVEQSHAPVQLEHLLLGSCGRSRQMRGSWDQRGDRQGAQAWET